MKKSTFLFRLAIHIPGIGRGKFVGSLKAAICLGFIFCSLAPAWATTYYLAAGGTLTSVTSWGTNTSGTGTNPANFTSGDIFNIRNNAAVTLTANWTVSGAGSGVTIGDGVSACNFTIPNNKKLVGSVLNIFANATLTLKNATLPTLTSCTFDPSSTVDFSSAPTLNIPIGATSYGNLTISGSGGANFSASTTITNTLNIASTGTVSLFNGATGAASYTITTANYIQSAGTVDGGINNATDPAGNNFNAYVYVTGTFNKTAGTLTNSSPNNYVVFFFNGGVAQNFSTAGTNDYVFCHVTNNTTLTLNTNMNLDATSLAKTTFTLDAGSTCIAGTNQITTNVASKTFEVDGTFKTASTGGFSGTATAAFSSANSPTVILGSASLVEYNATAAQTVTARTDYANVTISNSSAKTAAGACSMSGNFIINSTATFDASTYAHSIKGDFTNSGTFTATSSTVTLNGASTQTISGSSVTTFYALTISNSVAVTLSQAINVSNALALTSGTLNTTSTNILTMQNGSTAPALTATSTTYVNGPMVYQKSVSGSTTLNFPIGKSGDCRPAVLTVNHTTATLYNYTAESFNANPFTVFGSTWSDIPATIDTISGVHYVTIARTDNTGASQPSAGLSGNQSIQLSFGTNDFVYQGSSLTIVKNTSATPATWIDIGGTSTLGNFSSPQTGTVVSTSSPTAFTSFSSFALGSRLTGWNPLPIDLLDFNALPNNEKVNIEWHTVSERDNAYFTIEKSRDGKTFTKLIDIPGAGNSTMLREYLETDYQPYSGTSYYRIKQTDFNGNYKYFPAVAVNFGAVRNVIIYPNPAGQTDDIHVKVTGHQDEEVLVVLRDMQGHEYFSKILVSQAGSQTFIIGKPDGIPVGTYVIVASSDDKIYSYKLVVN